MTVDKNEDDLIAELEAGMSEDQIDLNVTFTAQLDAWFTLNYQRESIRVQYQRMVAMGKRSDKDPNLKPVIAQFGAVNEEMEVLESLMIDLLGVRNDPESVVKIVNASHYYPSKGIAYTVPEALKTRLLAEKTMPNSDQ